MGLRTPQEQPTRQVNPVRSPAFSPQAAPTLSTDFVNRLSQESIRQENARQAALAKKLKERDDFIKDQFLVKSEDAVMRARAEAVESKGTDAVRLTDRIRSKLQEQINTALNEAPEYARDALSAEQSRLMLKFESTAYPHVLQEQSKVKKLTLDARINQLMDDALERSANPDAFRQGLDQVRIEAARRAQMEYGEDPSIEVAPGITAQEASQKFQEDIISKAILRTIVQQSGVARVDLATKALVEYDQELTPEHRLEAIAAIEKGQNALVSDVARGLVDQAMQAHAVDTAAQERFIRANSANDKIYDQAMKIQRTRLIYEDREKRIAEESRMGRAYALAEQARTLTPEIMQLVPPGPDRDKIIDYINKRNTGAEITDDPAVFSKLTDMMTKNPEDFSNPRVTNLDAFAPYLSTSTMKMLKSSAQNIRQSIANENLTGGRTDERLAISVTEQFLALKGINQDNAQYARIYDDLKADFGRLALQEFYDIKDSTPNISAAELRRQLLGRLMNANIKTSRGWFDEYISKRIPFLANDRIEDYQIEGLNPRDGGEVLGPPERRRVFAPEPPSIDPSWHQYIQADRRSKNLPPLNESQMDTVLRALQSKGVRITEPVNVAPLPSQTPSRGATGDF